MIRNSFMIHSYNRTHLDLREVDAEVAALVMEDLRLLPDVAAFADEPRRVFSDFLEGVEPREMLTELHSKYNASELD